MAGPDGIYVIALYRQDVLQSFFSGDASAVQSAELMAVYTVEYQPFSVELEDTVTNRNFSKSYFLRYNFP